MFRFVDVQRRCLIPHLFNAKCCIGIMSLGEPEVLGQRKVLQRYLKWHMCADHQIEWCPERYYKFKRMHTLRLYFGTVKPSATNCNAVSNREWQQTAIT